MGSVIEISDVLFYVFAALAVAGAGGVAFSRNIVYSAFSLLLALFGVAAVYVFLSADLLAVVQLLVYIGGVLVLILFAIMLTSQIGSAEGTNPVVAVIPAAGLFALGTLILVYAAASAPWGEIAGAGLPVMQNAGLEPTAAKVGNALLTDYLLPFEIASVVLLAALIGAVIIARKEMRVLKPSQGGAAKSSALDRVQVDLSLRRGQGVSEELLQRTRESVKRNRSEQRGHRPGSVQDGRGLAVSVKDDAPKVEAEKTEADKTEEVAS